MICVSMTRKVTRRYMTTIRCHDSLPLLPITEYCPSPNYLTIQEMRSTTVTRNKSQSLRSRYHRLRYTKVLKSDGLM